MQFRKISVFLFMCLIFLGACNGKSAPEKMYEHMESAVALEQTFGEQQQPLVDLEKEEKKLYDKIINLDMDELDKIKELSTQALSIIDERGEIIKVEKESIEEAFAEFEKIQPLIKEIEEETVKNKAEEMYKVMEARYNAYLELNEVYAASLEQDRTLYEMLQKEDLKEEELKTHIKVVNEHYDQVLKLNESFNERTDEYNNLKEDFYNLAEIKVEYTEK